MAAKIRKFPSTPLGTHVVTDDSPTSASQSVTSGAATVYAVFLNNSANATKVFLKFYNSGSPTVGTTEPSMILMAPAGGSLQYTFLEGIVLGAACSYACVNTGGTACTNDPDQPVPVTIIADL